MKLIKIIKRCSTLDKIRKKLIRKEIKIDITGKMQNTQRKLGIAYNEKRLKTVFLDKPMSTIQVEGVI